MRFASILFILVIIFTTQAENYDIHFRRLSIQVSDSLFFENFNEIYLLKQDPYYPSKLDDQLNSILTNFEKYQIYRDSLVTADHKKLEEILEKERKLALEKKLEEERLEKERLEAIRKNEVQRQNYIDEVSKKIENLKNILLTNEKSEIIYHDSLLFLNEEEESLQEQKENFVKEIELRLKIKTLLTLKSDLEKSIEMETTLDSSYQRLYYLYNLKQKSLLEEIMSSSSKKIIVSIKEQILRFFLGDILVKEYPVSTSSYGIGSDYGSNKTPLGKHKIAAKIGDDLPLGTILINRKNTGRISNIYYDDQDRDTDSVLTRIMWLDGIETKNKNSKDRFIYIHGTPEEGLIGKTASHGCIRMKNRDVIELYDMVDTDTFVEIEEN